MMTIKNIAKRGFLNPIGSHNNGSYKWYLQLDDNAYFKEGESYHEISGGFLIYDCRKGIELNLYGSGRNAQESKELRNSIKKMRELAKQANACADKMEEFWQNSLR